LQKKFTGQTIEHELKITDFILDLQGKEFFYTVFYPQFKEPPDYTKDWLKPDACVVWKRGEDYKIQFVEVEDKKPGWENYLLNKKRNYELLAQDKNLYSMWWHEWHKKLNLPNCRLEDFCFSVLCNVKKDWEGWGVGFDF